MSRPDYKTLESEAFYDVSDALIEEIERLVERHQVERWQHIDESERENLRARVYGALQIRETARTVRAHGLPVGREVLMRSIYESIEPLVGEVDRLVRRGTMERDKRF